MEEQSPPSCCHTPKGSPPPTYQDGTSTSQLLVSSEITAAAKKSLQILAGKYPTQNTYIRLCTTTQPHPISGLALMADHSMVIRALTEQEVSHQYVALWIRPGHTAKGVREEILSPIPGDPDFSLQSMRESLQLRNSLDSPYLRRPLAGPFNVYRKPQLDQKDGDLLVTLSSANDITLREYLDRTLPSTAKAIKIVLDALKGLQLLHRRGLVHRNLSMDTIIVNTEGDDPIGQLAGFHLLAESVRLDPQRNASGTTPTDDCLQLGHTLSEVLLNLLQHESQCETELGFGVHFLVTGLLHKIPYKRFTSAKAVRHLDIYLKTN